MSNDTKVIAVNSVVKKFDSFTAVDSISFTVSPGQIFGFLGPNGAGKTTTIKMLTTLLTPTSGEILINGFSVVHDQTQVRQSIGIVFQDPSLEDELTAYENMEFHGVLYNITKEVRRRKIEELLQFVELWERKDTFVKTFSGGMKRRLEIARGLLHSPKVLFLDEPTSGLDPQTRNHIWQYIRNLSQKDGITIFFTTHYMEEAEEYADYIAILDRGKIISEGTIDMLLKQTKKQSLEQAFLSLTGKDIRDEQASGAEKLRMQKKIWRGR